MLALTRAAQPPEILSEAGGKASLTALEGRQSRCNTAFTNDARNIFWLARLPERVEALNQRSPSAREHRRVAQRVGTGFGFP